MALGCTNTGMERLFKYINPLTVVDVGANVGEFTNQLSKVFPQCEFVMVEANPYCEPYLKEVGKPYELVALSNQEGQKGLFIEKQNNIGTGASLYKENTQWYSEGMYDIINVPLSTLDVKNYFGTRNIDLLKLDVQGSELDILNGGTQTLERTDYILIETSLTYYNQNAPLIDEIVDKMLSTNFRIVDIIEYRKFNDIIFQLDILFKNNF